MSSPGKITYYRCSTTTWQSAVREYWYTNCPGYLKECHLSHECRYTNGFYDERKVR